MNKAHTTASQMKWRMEYGGKSDQARLADTVEELQRLAAGGVRIYGTTRRMRKQLCRRMQLRDRP